MQVSRDELTSESNAITNSKSDSTKSLVSEISQSVATRNMNMVRLFSIRQKVVIRVQTRRAQCHEFMDQKR